MSDEEIISQRRRNQIEEILLVLLIIFCLAGLVLTDYAPGDGYVYWLFMMIVFAFSAMFIAWLQSKHRVSDLKAILRDQSLHWGVSMLIVGAAFMVQKSGRIDSASASIVISLILSLSTILDGIRVGWRFSLVGVYLVISAVLASYTPHTIWQEILVALTIIGGTVLWEIRSRKRAAA